MKNSGLNRRKFIITSSTALAGAAVTKNLFASGDNQKNVYRKIRIGVVGGGFGAAFNWHKHPDCIVEAVSDLLESRRNNLMKAYNCSKSYESLEKLILDPKIDAVAIFTAPPDHVKHSVACMRAGKHVICAVPAFWSHNWQEQCEELIQTVKETGLTWMMAETSFYQQPVITARKWQKEGKFGNIFYSESEYLHPTDLSRSRADYGIRDWGFGSPPFWYPTHSTAFLTGITGERLVSVTCTGHGEKVPCLEENDYANPYYMEQAFFITDKGNTMRILRGYGGAIGHCDRASWYGDKMSFFMRKPQGLSLEKSTVIRAQSHQRTKDDAGFVVELPPIEEHEQTIWWNTDMLPAPLRQNSGHDGSHPFLIHEFIDSVLHDRKPAIDVYEAVAYTVPGFIAHQSAIRGGESLKIPGFDVKK
jgi:predicted dehydrogenase